MSKTLKLASVIFKNNSNLFAQVNSAKKSKKGGKATAIILAIAFIFIGISIFTISYSLFSVALLDNQGNPSTLDTEYIKNILTVFFPYLFGFLFIFLNSLVVSIFFLSNDSHVYLAMPIKPYQIFLARFISTLLTSYILEFVLLFPIYLSFNLVTSAGPLIYLNEVLLFLSMPFLPISITFILTIIIDLIVHIQRHREVFSFIYSILMIVGIIAIEFVVQFALPGEDLKEDVALIAQAKELMKSQAESLSFLNFINHFIVDGFTQNGISGLLNILAFVAISLGVLGIISFISNIFYQKSIMGEGEVTKKKHHTNEIKSSHHSSFQSYVLKEWKTIVRSPSACIQILFSPFLLIIILFISIFATYSRSQATMEELAEAIEYFRSVIALNSPIAPFIICAISALFSTMILASASAISREGKNAYLLKVLPISPMKQIHAKMSVGVLFASFFMLIIFIGGTIFLQLPWYLPILYFPLSFFTIIMINYIMILMDLKHPYLDWENEVAAMKQNRSVVMTMLILLGLFFAIILLGILFYSLAIPGYILLILLTAIVIGLTILIEKKMQKKDILLFKHLED